MNSLQNKWASRRIKHRLYAEITVDVMTWNQCDNVNMTKPTETKYKNVKTCNVTHEYDETH